MELNRWRGKTAVVTGAASGIGEAITRALLSSGINVVGLDIEDKAMAEMMDQGQVSGGRFNPIHCDVSSENDIKSAFKTVEKEFNGVDIMVNNAGVIDYGRIIESERSTFEKLVNINILGVATCSREAVRSMRARNTEGHIFNVNSLLGHEIPELSLSDKEGQNGYNLYPTCKHATVAMTHSIRREIKAAELPIRITSISPGLVKTGIAKAAGLQDLFDKIPALEPEDIADGLLYALGTRPEVQDYLLACGQKVELCGSRRNAIPAGLGECS